MKLQSIHTCPVWEEPNGSRRPGFDPDDAHPPVVGWCNVAVIDFDGEPRRFLLVHYE